MKTSFGDYKDLKEAERFFIIHKPKNVLITVYKDDNKNFHFFIMKKKFYFFLFQLLE